MLLCVICLFKSCVPFLYHYCTIIVPLLCHYCTILCHFCTIFEPLLYHYFTINVPFLYHYCTIILPLMYHFCTIIVRHTHTQVWQFGRLSMDRSGHWGGESRCLSQCQCQMTKTTIIISCHISSYLVISCHISSYLVISHPILSYRHRSSYPTKSHYML